MAFSAPGIGSNLDVASIVTQLMAVERRPLVALDRREATFQAQLSAYGSLKSALATLRSAVSNLTDATRLQAMSAIAADPSVAIATGSSTAVAGTYALQVSQLAQAQTLVATGQASASAALGTGVGTTITVQFGTVTGGTLVNGQYSGAMFTPDLARQAASISIDATNNSLEGIRDAINAAGIGITASIVNDGSGAPHRLTLTAAATGEKSSMKVSVDGDATLAALLAHDPAGTQNLTQTAAARNAEFTLNGVAVSSASNKVEQAIAGVTLNLAKTGSTQLTVSPDLGPAGHGISSFVNAYNELHKLIAQLTAYNAESRSGGTLNGDATTRVMQAQLRGVLGMVLPGMSGPLRTLADVGVSFQKDGTLALDNAKLQSAFAAAFRDVSKLFAVTGQATDNLIAYTSGTGATQPGTYAVNVTALATRGSTMGSVALTPTTTITSGVNDELALTIDGVAATVRLPEGSYTPVQLAAQLQTAISATSLWGTAGVGATVAVNGDGALVITSNAHGSSSTVSIGGGSAQADLFGAPASTTPGTDAAGTIGGVAALGGGRHLSGAAGTAAEGLRIEVLGGAPGARGTVSYSQGYAHRLAELLDRMLAAEGALSSRTEGVNRSIQDVTRQREALHLRLAEIEKRHRAQFAALDRMLGSMQQTSAFLQQQLAQLPKLER
jgi:flagellar hook-associated protein 2